MAYMRHEKADLVSLLVRRRLLVRVPKGPVTRDECEDRGGGGGADERRLARRGSKPAVGKMHGIGREKRREGAARGGAGSGAEMRRGTGDGMAS